MPPKPRKKRDDGDYVPSEEEVDDSEEVSEEETEETEETAKKTTKKTKKSKKEDYSSIPTEEETATTESPKKGSGRRKKDDEYEPSDSEGEDEGLSPGGSKAGEKKVNLPKIVVRNPTKKIAQMLKKGEEKLDEGKLTPPTPKKSSKKKNKDQVQATDNDNESNELDDLLASFPLPSSSRPRIFNKNIAMIGALNIQAFGKSKASNSVLMKIITDILRLYDIILCQEIRALDEIIRQLTESVSTPATPFDYVSSRLIGRTTYQERYVFLYRKNEWKVLEDYVVDDEKLGDKFIREPYVVRFQHLRKTDVRITLVGCHTQPDNAFDEIKTLVSSVYVDVKKKLVRDMVQEKRQLDRGTKVDEKHPTGLRSFLWKYFCCCFGYSPDSARDFTEEASTMGLSEDGTTKEPIIILGDLNASGSYLNKTQRIQIDTILKEFNLIWGIQHQSDTTVSDGSDAAYDRFIFEAANERRWIGKTGIWRFDEGWQKGKDDVDLIKKAARRVTDHYPIEFELKLV